MALKTFGSGWDPNSGWAPDDSTDVPWQSETDLPGQFQGGGAGFGPGGFQGSPRLTGPASGPPPGISLSANPGGGSAPATGGPGIFPPTNSTIPTNKSVGPFTGGTATDAIIRGAGNVARRFNPLRRIPLADIVTPTDELAPPSADEAPSWSYTPGAVRPVPRPAGEPSPSNVPDNFPDQTPKFPTPTGYPPVGTAPNFVRPEADVPRTYPSWPTPPAPAPFTGDPRNEPNNFPNSPNAIGAPVPTPIGSPAPAIPPRRVVPRAAGPAAVRQQPNLGNYGPFTTITRPNMNPGIGGGMLGGGSAGGRGGAGGPPQMTALDLSKLFSRQQ